MKTDQDKYDYLMMKYETKTVNKIKCFTINSGTTFCPPSTPIMTEKSQLNKIFLRMHLNDKFDIKNAVYFSISYDGKIEFPIAIEDKYDCREKEFNK